MALRMWASSTANALGLSRAATPALSRCFSSVLEGLKYASSHEWVKHEGAVATIGITDHAQDHLGEVVFVELPEIGGSVGQGGSFGAVESVKVTSDVNSPISGEVVEVNSKLTETPGLTYSCLLEQWMKELGQVTTPPPQHNPNSIRNCPPRGDDFIGLNEFAELHRGAEKIFKESRNGN